MDSGPVYGMPMANPIIKMNRAARIAIIPCPPTKEPILEMIALVNFATRSLREFGTKRRPIFTTLSNEDKKYRVKTRIVIVATTPETKARPTPTTPPNAVTTKAPSLITELTLLSSESITPYLLFKSFINALFFKSLTNCGALSIKELISSIRGGIAIQMKSPTNINTEPTTILTA